MTDLSYSDMERVYAYTDQFVPFHFWRMQYFSIYSTPVTYRLYTFSRVSTIAVFSWTQQIRMLQIRLKIPENIHGFWWLISTLTIRNQVSIKAETYFITLENDKVISNNSALNALRMTRFSINKLPAFDTWNHEIKAILDWRLFSFIIEPM